MYMYPPENKNLYLPQDLIQYVSVLAEKMLALICICSSNYTLLLKPMSVVELPLGQIKNTVFRVTGLIL